MVVEAVDIAKEIRLITAFATGLNLWDGKKKASDGLAAEVLQVVSYGAGGHYEPHVDYFGNNMVDLERGDRVATMLFYVSEDEDDAVVGGATVFPFLDLAVKPERGSALFWYNTYRNGQGGNPETFHAACPVIKGTKWIANQWVRENAQCFVRPCSLENPA